GQIVQTVQIQATGAHQQLVDLGAFEWITKIRLHNITDTFGLGWDDVSFTPVPVSADFDDVPKGTMLAEDHYLCLLLSSSAGARPTAASGPPPPPGCVRLGAADAPALSVECPAPVERFGLRYEWKNAPVGHPTFQVHVSVGGQFHV